MASTFVNDLRLEEIGSGEQSGTWGDTTNTNLELIAEAFSFGTEAIATNVTNSVHTTTIADGATDPGRSMFLRYTGSQNANVTVTIAPPTVSKLWFIENATSGSSVNLIIKQGSGDTVTIPAGQTKAIYSNGAGSGASMVDAFATLNVVDLLVDDDLTVTDDVAIGGTLAVTGIATFTDDIIIGDGKTIGSASDVDAITIAANGQVTLTQTLIGTALDISGDIDVDGTTNLDIVDIDGAVNMATTALVTGVLTTTAATVFNGGFASNAGSTIAQVNNTSSLIGARFNASNRKIGFNANNSNGQGFIASNSNSVSGSANQTYDVNGEAARIDFASGVHIDVAASGTAGDAITYVDVADFTTTGTVFNGGGANLDFQVKSDGNANALFVDGGGKSTGINVVPEASHAPSLAIGFGGNNITSRGNVDFRIMSGAFQDGSSTFQYAVSSLPVSMLSMTNGGFAFQSAPAGTDGNAATFTTKLFIDPDGTISTPTLGANNVRFGVNAGDALTSNSVRNVIIGDDAGSALNGGDESVLIGYNAGEILTSGTQNVAIGALALQLGVSATNNVAVGRSALASTLGSENVAVGVNTLTTNQGGSHSIAIGSAALTAQNPSSGNVNFFNTAVGSSAGAGVTTGTLNTYLGGKAGLANTVGHNNVALGFSSLLTDSHGSQSVAVGVGALQTQDNGTTAKDFLNTAVGYNAGLAVTTGGGNTLIGGRAGDSVTDGTFNTFVGMDAGGASTGDYNTFIGAGTIAGTGNFGSGSLMTTGSKNTILGGYNGHTSSLDLRAQSNHIVISDGDGNVRVLINGAGELGFNAAPIGTVTLNVLADSNNHAMVIKSVSSGFASAIVDNTAGGDLLSFRVNNSERGRIRTTGNDFIVAGTVANISGLQFAHTKVLPMKANSLADNQVDLGSGSYRYKVVYAGTGSINTSDKNEKQNIAALTSAEMLVAKRVSTLFKTFRFKDSVTDKGENARTHSGIIAQDVKAAFEAEGLTAANYGLWCSDTWWEHDVDVAAIEADDTTDLPIEAVDAYTRTDAYETEDEAPSGSTKKTRLGIRYPELLSFLAAYNEQRFAAIETRLTALEG